MERTGGTGLEYRNGTWTSETSERVLREVKRLAEGIVRTSADPVAVAEAKKIIAQVSKLL